MKADRDHRVPLADRALGQQSQARELGDGQGLVFQGARSGRPLSDMTHRNLMNDLGLAAPDGRPAVPHGFRSSFKDWASETGVPEVVSELALAHVRKNQTEAAYARSDLFDRRRVLMDQWAGYLS
jgi:integrase